MKVAIVGATGLVGSVMLKVLEERTFRVTEFLPVASKRSSGRDITFRGRTYKVMSIEEAIAQKPQIALFSAGSAISMEWAHKFANAGAVVIDNSSAWRMHPDIRLVVPEINANVLRKKDRIIANPNCSTIQMLMPLYPIHKKYGISRIVVSTYQAVTGTGMKAVEQLMNERKNIPSEKVYPYPIDLNLIPQIADFNEEGYTKEEVKMIEETKKILDDNKIKVTATCVRVPVIGGHSESVNVELKKDYKIEDIRKLLADVKGVKLQDDFRNSNYPMPIYAQGKDDVFVGRIRKDNSVLRGLNMWIVADNLRKGAATNAVQIAEYMVAKKLV
ncbi:MAG TPA: aspartate-semialdehyde dehydrogenase [Bacteroidia bacterium]|nr:aspartate-semialdehyde dehydrogenase [Bacteroidia bacterium]